MNKVLKIILGLLLILGSFALILPGFPLESWGNAALNLIKGGIILLVILAGIILLVIGLIELKE